MTRTDHVLTELDTALAMRDRTGELTRPDGTGGAARETTANIARWGAHMAEAFGTAAQASWGDRLNLATAHALAAPEPAELRTRLIQVASLATAWCATLDRRADLENDN